MFPVVHAVEGGCDALVVRDVKIQTTTSMVTSMASLGTTSLSRMSTRCVESLRKAIVSGTWGAAKWGLSWGAGGSFFWG